MEFVGALGIYSHSWGLALGLGARSVPVQPRVASGDRESSSVCCGGAAAGANPCHRQLLSGACPVPRALPRRRDLSSWPGSSVAVEQRADRGVRAEPMALQALQRWTEPVRLCSPHCHPWGQSNTLRQLWARMQLSRKSSGILVMNLSQQCALVSPVQEKHLKPGLSPVKDHQASEELEHRIIKGRLRLLCLSACRRGASGRT